MKNVFSIQYENKQFEGGVSHGEPFTLRTVSEATSKALEDAYEAEETVTEKHSLSPLLSLLQAIGGWLFVIVATSGLTVDGGFKQAYINAPGLMWAGGLGGIIWLGLWLYKKKLGKTAAESGEPGKAKRQTEALERQSLLELNIPLSAPKTDVLFFLFTEKNGKIKYITPLSQFMNLETYLFIEGDKLCFGTTEAVTGIPLHEIHSLRLIKKKIQVSSWNKSEAYNSKTYKPYKITVNNMGILFMKHYLELSFRHNGEDLTVFFPPYEAETLSKLIGKPIE